MSRKKNRNRVPQVAIARPEISEGGFVSTFAGEKRLDLRNTNDLMNWLVFGEEKKMYNIATNLT